MIQHIALTTLLGFELVYYLLIIQTGLAESYHSDLLALAPVFIGGVAGSVVSGYRWGRLADPVQKLIAVLALQSLLTYWYPDYNALTLFLLGISVGAAAPLAIYLFTPSNRSLLLMALGTAYAIGTYNFTVNPLHREIYGMTFSLIALGSSLFLVGYKAQKEHYLDRAPYGVYLLLMVWVMLDSYLFETLSRHSGLMIWRGEFTYVIITGHLFGLVAAYVIPFGRRFQHLLIGVLFALSYIASYMEWTLMMAIVYPVVISYYNVTVFLHLSRVETMARLGYLMVFIGWFASGAGLGLALTGWLH
jgi:hypothetical protein